MKLERHVDHQTPWKTIIRVHILDYINLIIMIVLTIVLDKVHVSQHYVYHINGVTGTYSDQDLWAHSYPQGGEQIPAWAVPVISLLVPLAVMLIYFVVKRPPFLEIHSLVLGFLSAMFISAAFTNFLKITTGKLRPDFAARCWPNNNANGAIEAVFGANGRPLCAANNNGANKDGRKSFVSGHASWTASGLGYLSFWLAFKLRVYDGSGHPWRFVVAFTPLWMSVWIGITRYQDYVHSGLDVFAGLIIGAIISYAIFRQYMPSILTPDAVYQPLAALDPHNKITHNIHHDHPHGSAPVGGVDGNGAGVPLSSTGGAQHTALNVEQRYPPSVV